VDKKQGGELGGSNIEIEKNKNRTYKLGKRATLCVLLASIHLSGPDGP